jgi:poly(A) polymerase
LLSNLIKYPGAAQVFSALEEGETQARFIGGCVRDALLNLKCKDIDIATPLLPEKVLELLKKHNIKAILTGIKFGTITAVCESNHFEITTLRIDTSCDGRHAIVEYTDDWQQDAKRRDFTINAMSCDKDGKIYDYFNGQQDLKKNKIKFVGDAHKRIEEDYLRILRYFRFFAYYGQQPFDLDAISNCKANAKYLKNLSGERIQAEMMKLLAAPDPLITLNKMCEINLFEHLFLPTPININILSNLIDTEQQFNLAPQGLLRLACLLYCCNNQQFDLFKNSWRLSTNHAEIIYKILFTKLSSFDEFHIKKIIRILGNPLANQLVLFNFAINNNIDSKIYDLTKNWQVPIFPIKGDDLLKIGAPQNKTLGILLEKSIDLWEANNYQLTKEQILDYIRQEI